MLHQISWNVFLTGTFLILFIYYGWITFLFYRTELLFYIGKYSGKSFTGTRPSQTVPVPVFDIIGAVATETTFAGPEDQLHFGPDDEEERLPALTDLPNVQNSQLVGEFSGMIGEVKTLIRVIIESCETKENFEMLFRLIVHKYPELAGTAYQSQVNDFLIDESGSRFGFELDKAELNAYWTN